jgi:hypothetical protein
MAYWELFQDPADIGHYIEIRIAETWTEHMCQHERVTKNIQIMEDKNPSTCQRWYSTNSFSLYRKNCSNM